MKALLARKIGMSQVFSPEGDVTPVTVVVAADNVVTIRREQLRDGYAAVQLSLPRDNKPSPEPIPNKMKPRQRQKLYVAQREFRTELANEVQTMTVEQFSPGDVVEVSGISKGKGFQGVVKRHGFKGGPASHGHSDWERKGGSIGSRFPQHTRKGKRMAGRMGSDRVTVKNLTILRVDATQKLLAIKGAIPGKPGTVVEIRSAVE